MALFGKLFEKKECAICGGEIGLLGNRKLEDGNCCKQCAAKLSPWFSDRRQSTVEEIKEQLAYREANQEKVAAFHVTRTLGESTKVLLDEDAGKFMVTSARSWQEANPDVLSFSDVTGCQLDIEEHKTEIEYKDQEGKRQSFNPRRRRLGAGARRGRLPGRGGRLQDQVRVSGHRSEERRVGKECGS